MEHLLPKFNVIPCKGKVPLVSWANYTTKMPTAEERSNWNNLYPGGDRGIICGPVSGLFVLDVDGSEGEKSIEGLHIPRTPTVKTPHGRHFYFRWIPELNNKITTKVGILNKVDVRGFGGFVRFYSWERGPHLAPLMAPPKWLIDLLPDKGGSRTIEGTFKKLDVVEVLKNATEENHNRNASFAQLAGSLRSRGFELQEIYEFLLPKAKIIGFPETELQLVVQSICRYPAGQRPPISEVLIPDDIEQFLQDEERVDYLVPGIFAKRSICFVAGLPETCKTWTLIDLAIELARKPHEKNEDCALLETSGLWLGRYPVKHAKVLYIDQERDKAETQRRFKALIAAKQLSLKELKSSLDIKCRTTIRLNLKESLSAFKQLLARSKPEVVLVDSFKTFHTCDINSNVQMQEVMEILKDIKNEFGCTFIMLFHENKGAHERVGSDGKKKQVGFDHMAGAAVMSEVPETILITVKQDQDTSFLHHVKHTYGKKIAPVLVSVENIENESKIRVIAR